MSNHVEEAKALAHDLLIAQYDDENHIPTRAGSHTDLWAGDRWIEAYLAADEPEIASEVMQKVADSIRPDGAVPHLVQGSHVRAGIETRWIDRQVYRLQGNGAIRLPNGEWVTKSFAQPTLALSALAIKNAGLLLPKNLDLAHISRASQALRSARGDVSGMIFAEHPDELTNSSGSLADILSVSGRVPDSAINALAVLNNEAIDELQADEEVSSVPEENEHLGTLSRTSLISRLNVDHARNGGVIDREYLLAVARLSDVALPELTDSDLEVYLAPPMTNDQHPERTRMTIAECLEVARLTPHLETSQRYIERIASQVTKLGFTGLTRYEGSTPGTNAISNKYSRKQVWLPTAAEIVQLPIE